MSGAEQPGLGLPANTRDGLIWPHRDGHNRPARHDRHAGPLTRPREQPDPPPTATGHDQTVD